jgi:hypothetical protein
MVQKKYNRKDLLVCKKRILSHFRDKRSMFILFGMPIAQIVFGFLSIDRNQQRENCCFRPIKRY